MKSLYYIWSESRAHKLLPILEDFDVKPVRGFADIVRNRLRESGGECVIVDSFGSFAVKGILLSFLVGLPLVIRLRGDFIKELDEVYRMNPSLKAGLLRAVHRLIGEFCIRRSALVIVNSEHLKTVFTERYRSKRVDVVYNPYTPGRHRHSSLPGELPARGLRLLSATNFNLRSKVEPIVRAMEEWLTPELWEKLDVHWAVCGTGSLSAEFREHVAGLAQSDRISYLGYIDDIAPLLEWCDLFVHLSELDAFPNVTMEAMIHGKPVVTNSESCGTLEQVFHMMNGFVVSNGDEFSDAIEYVSEHQDAARRFGEEGRRIVDEKFSVAVQRERMREALSALQGSGNE